MQLLSLDRAGPGRTRTPLLFFFAMKSRHSELPLRLRRSGRRASDAGRAGVRPSPRAVRLRGADRPRRGWSSRASARRARATSFCAVARATMRSTASPLEAPLVSGPRRRPGGARPSPRSADPPLAGGEIRGLAGLLAAGGEAATRIARADPPCDGAHSGGRRYRRSAAAGAKDRLDSRSQGRSARRRQPEARHAAPSGPGGSREALRQARGDRRRAPGADRRGDDSDARRAADADGAGRQRAASSPGSCTGDRRPARVSTSSPSKWSRRTTLCRTPSTSSRASATGCWTSCCASSRPRFPW